MDFWKLFIDLKTEAGKAAGYTFYLAAAITLVAIPIIAWKLTDIIAMFAGLSLFVFVEAAIGFLILWAALSLIIVPLWLIVSAVMNIFNL